MISDWVWDSVKSAHSFLLLSNITTHGIESVRSLRAIVVIAQHHWKHPGKSQLIEWTHKIIPLELRGGIPSSWRTSIVLKSRWKMLTVTTHRLPGLCRTFKEVLDSSQSRSRRQQSKNSPRWKMLHFKYLYILPNIFCLLILLTPPFCLFLYSTFIFWCKILDIWFWVSNPLNSMG